MYFVDFQVPTMYARLLQGYITMDPDRQEAVASAAKQLRLMVIIFSSLVFTKFLNEITEPNNL